MWRQRVSFLTIRMVLSVSCPWAPGGCVPQCSLSLGTRGSCPSLFYVHGHPRVLFLTVPCPWATESYFSLFLVLGQPGGGVSCPSLFFVSGPPRVLSLTVLCPWAPEGLVPHCSLTMGTRGSCYALLCLWLLLTSALSD